MVRSNHWMSVEQLADYLSISKETIYRWLEKGTVPAHRVGKLWRFETNEIDEWVKDGGAANTRYKSQTQKSV
jgi:excisionase family DNA binding protein